MSTGRFVNAGEGGRCLCGGDAILAQFYDRGTVSPGLDNPL